MLRNILAVAGGFIVWTIGWLGFFAAASSVTPQYFNEDGSTDSAGVLVAFLIASMVCSLLAGWVIPLIARGPQIRLAWVLGIILLAVGIGVQASAWDSFPLWYNLIFLAALVPVTLFGHNLNKR
ncbi:MAG: hypothetical protein R2834_20870 [Rhodothermales bacterium]